MNAKEQKIKMELLEKLMAEMDDSVMSSLKKDEEPTVHVKEVEEKEMPLGEAKDFIKEKLAGSMPEDDEPAAEEEMEEPSEEEDDEDYGDSRLMARLKELKRKKKELA